MSGLFAVFGYGSLVNAATLPAGARSIPGRLSGYRRAWRIAGTTPFGPACGLTVEPCEDTVLNGALVVLPKSELPSLDEREWRYDRHPLDLADFAPETDDDPIPDETIIYQVKPIHRRWGDAEHPLVQSYIDCVLRGYFERWGVLGVRHFVETTAGWHIPIRRDRAEPRYRRAVRITAEEEALFDRILQDAGAVWL